MWTQLIWFNLLNYSTSKSKMFAKMSVPVELYVEVSPGVTTCYVVSQLSVPAICICSLKRNSKEGRFYFSLHFHFGWQNCSHKNSCTNIWDTILLNVVHFATYLHLSNNCSHCGCFINDDVVWFFRKLRRMDISWHDSYIHDGNSWSVETRVTNNMTIWSTCLDYT